MAAEPGFEPGLEDSKSPVLPLHNSAFYLKNFCIISYRWCRRSDSNRHEGRPPTVFETAASTIPPLRLILQWSGRRDSNSRPPPWQGGVLPLNYFRPQYGAEAQNRTGDTRIFSPLLYRLSYLGTESIVAFSSVSVKGMSFG